MQTALHDPGRQAKSLLAGGLFDGLEIQPVDRPGPTSASISASTSAVNPSLKPFRRLDGVSATGRQSRLAPGVADLEQLPSDISLPPITILTCTRSPLARRSRRMAQTPQGAHSAPRRERRGAMESPQADAGGFGRSPV